MWLITVYHCAPCDLCTSFTCLFSTGVSPEWWYSFTRSNVALHPTWLVLIISQFMFQLIFWKLNRATVQLCLHEKYTCTFEYKIMMPFCIFQDCSVHIALSIVQVFVVSLYLSFWLFCADWSLLTVIGTYTEEYITVSEFICMLWHSLYLYITLCTVSLAFCWTQI